MKVILVNGSPRKSGNTAKILRTLSNHFVGRGDDVIFHDLVDMDVHDCIGCMKCKRVDACSIGDDMVAVYGEIREADAIVIGSPIYAGAETGITKCFLDRMYALLEPGNGPQGVVTRLERGKKAFAFFPCRRTKGAQIYSNTVSRYEEVLGMLGMEAKAMILPGVHIDVDALNVPSGAQAIEACKAFLTE